MSIDSSLPSVCDEKLPDLLLYGNRRLDTKTKQNILIGTDLTTCFSKLFVFFLPFLFDDLHVVSDLAICFNS